MSVFEKYKTKKPSEFTRLVGVNYGTFEIILEKLKAELISCEQAKPMRQRGLESSLLIKDLIASDFDLFASVSYFSRTRRNVFN